MLMARVIRLPNVRSTSSGACLAPNTRRFAQSVSRSLAGAKLIAATAAATIERASSCRSEESDGGLPRPSTTTR